MSAWKGHADLAASRGQHHSLWTVSTVYQGGREPCEEVLYLASWTIVVTNVPRARQRIPEALVRLATAMAKGCRTPCQWRLTPCKKEVSL